MYVPSKICAIEQFFGICTSIDILFLSFSCIQTARKHTSNWSLGNSSRLTYHPNIPALPPIVCNNYRTDTIIINFWLFSVHLVIHMVGFGILVLYWNTDLSVRFCTVRYHFFHTLVYFILRAYFLDYFCWILILDPRYDSDFNGCHACLFLFPVESSCWVSLARVARG